MVGPSETPEAHVLPVPCLRLQCMVVAGSSETPEAHPGVTDIVGLPECAGGSDMPGDGRTLGRRMGMGDRLREMGGIPGRWDLSVPR